MAPKTHLEYHHEKGMLGPFDFHVDAIDEIDDDAYGVYLLTHEAKDEDGLVVVVYVGRGEIKERLNAHLEDDKDALHFFYKELVDEDDGFAEECRLFHRYGKRQHLYNKVHPAVPPGSPRNYRRCFERGCNGEPD